MTYICHKPKYTLNTDSKKVVWTKFEKKSEKIVKSTWNLIVGKRYRVKINSFNRMVIK